VIRMGSIWSCRIEKIKTQIVKRVNKLWIREGVKRGYC
jgi:hypothetical protein